MSFKKDVTKAAQEAFSGSVDFQMESAESGNQILKMEMIEVEVWAEHETDIRFQIVPPNKRITLHLKPSVAQRQGVDNDSALSVDAFVGKQLERIIKREFGNRRVRASVHGWQYGERIARNSDINQKGMTLFDVTIHAGYSAYHAVERLIKGFAHLDKIMAGEEMPLES